MQCCGRLIDITDQDDPAPVWMCEECGKQGTAAAFPDPRPPARPDYTRVQSLRLRVADWLCGVADFIAPDIR